MKLKIYLIESKIPVGWDEYKGHVITASSPEEALTYSLIAHNDITIEEIGIANKTNKTKGINLSSFRAG